MLKLGGEEAGESRGEESVAVQQAAYTGLHNRWCGVRVWFYFTVQLSSVEILSDG